MVGVHALKAMVATPSNDREGTGARVDRKLPNEATIISRVLKMAMGWFEAVGAMVATPINDPGGDRSSRRSKTSKPKPIYLNARSHRTS